MLKKVTRDAAERRAAIGDKRKRGGRTISHAVFTRKLLMTMWFLATGCTYREVGEQFGFDTDYRTLLIDEIALMRDNYVQWPATDADVMRVAAEFAELRGFTGCVGAIDGTYIRILGPWMRTVAPEEYNTYKKFYATTLLAVADTHLKIRYMNVGWPGSRTDSHILKQTDLYQNPQSYIPSGFYLFGDSGFAACIACHSNCAHIIYMCELHCLCTDHWLVTPYSKAQCKRNPSCYDFNYNHASTRVVVEQVRDECPNNK